MDFELKFTSAEAGVKRSAQGFCTVFATAGTPPPLVERLESLSVYRHLFPAGQPGEERNPIAFSHVIVPVFGEPHHVLSRVQSAGLDYSKRFNYFAHHRVVDAADLPACGPAWLLGRPEVLQSAWDGIVATPPACRPLVSRSVQPAVARYWQTVTGDAGWAGWVLERWQANPDGETVFIVAPGDPVLELVQECVALLPTAARWRFTFSTYATKLPPDVECHLRFAVAGTPEAQTRNAVDLRSLRGQSPPASPFIDAARQGKEAPIVLAARASGVGPRPAAAFKLSNLGDLPPLPSEAARPTSRTDASATTPSGSSNKNILLIAVAAIFLMLCGAGYMFWDAQQRDAARLAEAEREIEEQKNAIAEVVEKGQSWVDERSEQGPKPDAKSKEESAKPKLAIGNAEVRTPANEERRPADKSPVEPKKDVAPPNPTAVEKTKKTEKLMEPVSLTYLGNEIKPRGGRLGGEAPKPQVLFQSASAVGSLAIHWRVTSPYVLDKRDRTFVVLLKSADLPMAAFDIADNEVSFRWIAEDAKTETLRAALRESVLEVTNESNVTSTLCALRVPLEKPPLYGAWIVQAVDVTRDKDVPPPVFASPADKAECESWLKALDKTNASFLQARIIRELDATGNEVPAFFHRIVLASGLSKYEAAHEMPPKPTLKGEFVVVSPATLSNAMPLKVTFTPTGSQLADAHKKQMSRAARARMDAEQYFKIHFGSDKEQLEQARKKRHPDRPKTEAYDQLVHQAKIELDEAERIMKGLQFIDRARQRSYVGSVYFNVKVRDRELPVDVIRFGMNMTAAGKKGSK